MCKARSALPRGLQWPTLFSFRIALAHFMVLIRIANLQAAPFHPRVTTYFVLRVHLSLVATFWLSTNSRSVHELMDASALLILSSFRRLVLALCSCDLLLPIVRPVIPAIS